MYQGQTGVDADDLRELPADQDGGRLHEVDVRENAAYTAPQNGTMNLRSFR